jgi:hypothetical protein
VYKKYTAQNYKRQDYRHLRNWIKKKKEEKTDKEQVEHHQDATVSTTSSSPTVIGSNTRSVAPPTHRRSRHYRGF